MPLLSARRLRVQEIDFKTRRRGASFKIIARMRKAQRGAELMREDMEALGPVKIKDVDGAQPQIITIIRELENEGVLNLRGAVGEQYVV